MTEPERRACCATTTDRPHLPNCPGAATVAVPEPFQDLDALVAMAIAGEDVRLPFRGVDEIAVRAIVALSHAGVALAEYRRRAPRVKVYFSADPREQARRLISELITERGGTGGR